jgi:pyridoxal phosphate enzyme (YggS family)
VTITQSVAQILSELPDGVQLLVAAKSRGPQQIMEAITAGAGIIGENYVQEAEEAYQAIGRRAEWHFIGHLQRNKVKTAVAIFDMIETVDSVAIAREIDKRCAQMGKVMPVLIEINSGREEQKTGVYPEDAREMVTEIATCQHIRVMGLMTMGPVSGSPEDARPYFAETGKIFDSLKKLNLPHVEMKYLSMGMSHSYRIALEEGANIIRIGDKIFGKRLPTEAAPDANIR